MKLSLSFFFAEVTEKFGKAELSYAGKHMPAFSTIGILAEGADYTADMLYLDLLDIDDTEIHDPGVSVVIHASKRERFRDAA